MRIDANHAMCFANRLCAAHQKGREMDLHHQRLRDIARGSGRGNFSLRSPSDPNRLRRPASGHRSQLQAERELKLVCENQTALARLRLIEQGHAQECRLKLEQRQATGRATHATAAARERRRAQASLEEANAKHRQRVSDAKPKFASPAEIAILQGRSHRRSPASATRRRAPTAPSRLV
jgi:hypothetical protein